MSAFILNVFKHLLQGDGYLLLDFAGIIALYMLLRVAYLVASLAGDPAPAISPRREMRVFVRACAVILASLATGLFVVAYAIHVVGIAASPEEITAANTLLMSFDYALFGTYVPFWMHESGSVQKISLTYWRHASYGHTATSAP